MTRRVSLSLDLDDKWSYLKTHGDPAWQEFPGYLNLVVPRILEFLRQRDLRISFFVIGQDAALPQNREPLRRIAESGHEICSHSFHHDPWLHLYSHDELQQEMARAEEAIEEATGHGVKGFRGPGFSLSTTTLEVLLDRGYRFDATAFPNLLNPLARAYFLAKSQLSPEERKRRAALFGSFKAALRPVKPYRWRLSGGSLIELPVTTMPWFKVPIHFSYLIYLGGYSEALARAYLRWALLLCRWSRIDPSLLLHPLDFLGAEEEPDLGFFPGMTMGTEKKLRLMGDFFDILSRRFRPITIGEHIQHLSQGPPLPDRLPDFRRSERVAATA